VGWGVGYSDRGCTPMAGVGGYDGACGRGCTPKGGGGGGRGDVNAIVTKEQNMFIQIMFCQIHCRQEADN
jgi:hypothetical protein